MLTRTRKKHWPSRCLSVDIKKNTADEKNRVFRLISCLINRATCRCEAKSDPVKNHVKRRHRTTMTKTILYLTLSRCPWSLVNFSCHLSAWRLLAKKTAIKKMLLIELKLYVISGSARTALLYFLSSPYHTDIRLTEWLSDWSSSAGWPHAQSKRSGGEMLKPIEMNLRPNAAWSTPNWWETRRGMEEKPKKTFHLSAKYARDCFYVYTPTQIHLFSIDYGYYRRKRIIIITNCINYARALGLEEATP